MAKLSYGEYKLLDGVKIEPRAEYSESYVVIPDGPVPRITIINSTDCD